MENKSIRIAHLYPELLNLYGDTGNIICLKKRLQWRGIDADVVEFHAGDTVDLDGFDIVFIGGGTDREQKIVAQELKNSQESIAKFVEDDGVLLAVCGGYQLLGSSYLLGEEKVEGLGIVDFYTDRKSPRIIGNIVIDCPSCNDLVVGYENHGGRTHLGEGVEPFGKVVVGGGNDAESGYEGVCYKNVIGTYIHGPLLPKNPKLADSLIKAALVRKYGEGSLVSIDDTEETRAHDVMCKRIIDSGKSD